MSLGRHATYIVAGLYRRSSALTATSLISLTVSRQPDQLRTNRRSARASSSTSAAGVAVQIRAFCVPARRSRNRDRQCSVVRRTAVRRQS